MNRLDQLHKGALAILHTNLAFAVAIDDLPQQSDFPHAALHQPAAFAHDILNAPAALASAGVGYDAKGAELVAALHDAHKGRHRLGFALCAEQMFTNGPFTALLFVRVHHLVAAAIQQLIKILTCTVKFLGPKNQIHIRQLIH